MRKCHHPARQPSGANPKSTAAARAKNSASTGKCRKRLGPGRIAPSVAVVIVIDRSPRGLPAHRSCRSPFSRASGDAVSPHPNPPPQAEEGASYNPPLLAGKGRVGAGGGEGGGFGSPHP